MLWIFLIINLLSFLLCGLDKYCALHHKWRIPELISFLCSLLGGCFGFLLAMFLFHHKTKKRYFLFLELSFCFLWIFLCFFLIRYQYDMTHFYQAEDFGFTVIKSSHDENQNGIDDYTDILLGARKEAENHPIYKSAYYKGGYPPENEGVCTDVIWRAFKHAGYSLKDMVDEDIKNHLSDYPRVGGKPDSNIDFRRVKNLIVFFRRNSTVLSNDINQIEKWMPGDIVVFGNDYSHIAIISDRRNRKGIPWIIHNANQPNREENALEYWSKARGVSGHFRFSR